MSGFLGSIGGDIVGGALAGVTGGASLLLGGSGSSKPSSSANTADNTLANLYTQQWNNYVKQFEPVENSQIGLMSGSANELEKRQGQQAVTGAYAQSLPNFRSQALGYGVPLTPQAVQSFQQRSNTQEGLDKVTSYNRTAQNQQDRFYGNLGGFGSATGNSGNNQSQVTV